MRQSPSGALLIELANIERYAGRHFTVEQIDAATLGATALSPEHTENV
jgi:hypothetical protein